MGLGPGRRRRRRPDRRGDRLRLRQPPRHGIFRDVPGLDPADPVQVSSPTAPAQVEATGTAQQTRLRIGDPERTVTGRHRYTIGYRLGGVGGPGQRLAWDAVGTSWPVGIARAELHLAAPYRLEGVTCLHGDAGSAAPCRVDQPEPGHLVATVEGLDAGEGVTLYASAGTRLPAAPALPAPPAPPADPGTGPYPPALVALAAALAGAPATSWWVRRAGRERVVSGGAAEAAFGGRRQPPGAAGRRGRPGRPGHRRVRAPARADPGPGGRAAGRGGPARAQGGLADRRGR